MTATSTASSKPHEGGGVSVERVYMARHMGLAKACSAIISTVIGTGIFLTPRGITENIGSVGASLVMWTVCGISSTIGALMYAEMGAVIPRAGGEYAFVTNSFGPAVGFSTLWGMAFIVRPLSLALMSRAAGQYFLQIFFPNCIISRTLMTLFAIWIILTLVYICCANLRLAATIQVLFSAAKVGALCIIIITGVVQMAKGRVENLIPSKAFEGTKLEIGAIALAAYGGYFTFSGWEMLSILQEEVKNPRRNIPLATVLSMAVVIVVYLMANISYFTVMTPAELVASPAVAITFARRTLGYFYWIIPVFVALSATGSIGVGALGGSRLVFSGSRDEKLPIMLAMLHPTRNTPIPAVIVITVIGLLFLVIPTLDSLILYNAVVTRIRNNLAFASFFYFRWKHPEWDRPVKVNIFLASLSYLFSLALFVLGFIRAPVTSAVGTALYLSAFVVYFYNEKIAKRTNWILTITGKITTLLQQFLFVVPEEKKAL